MGFNKICSFQIAVYKIRTYNICTDETAVVQVGFIKNGIGNSGSVKVDIYKLSAFKSALLYGGACQGQEL